jgi:hypothetical protein
VVIICPFNSDDRRILRIKEIPSPAASAWCAPLQAASDAGFRIHPSRHETTHHSCVSFMPTTVTVYGVSNWLRRLHQMIVKYRTVSCHILSRRRAFRSAGIVMLTGFGHASPSAAGLSNRCGSRPPQSEGLSSELLERWSVQKIALVIEGVVDGGMDGQKALRAAGRLEPQHLPLSSSNRLV